MGEVNQIFNYCFTSEERLVAFYSPLIVLFHLKNFVTFSDCHAFNIFFKKITLGLCIYLKPFVVPRLKVMFRTSAYASYLCVSVSVRACGCMF